MASWFDDLLKRQEYEAIQGRPTFKPNAFQEMFTPKGMEYQWQDRVNEDSGEFSTGDMEDLRMVNVPPTVVTPPVVTPSTPYVPIEGGDNTTIDGSYLMTRPYPRRFSGRVPPISTGKPPVVAATEAKPVRTPVVETRPTARPVPVSEPLDRARSRWSRWSRWGAPEVGAGTKTVVPPITERPPLKPGVKYGPGGYGGGPDPMPRPTATPVPPPEPMDRTRGRWSRWNRWGGPMPKPVSPRMAPGSEAGRPLESRPVTSGVGAPGAAPERFGLRTNIPDWLKNKGLGKTAMLARGLNPAGWALTAADVGTALFGDPTGWSGRRGLFNQDQGGSNLVDINAQRAMQGLPPIAGQGAGEGGMQDITEYTLDPRNYSRDNWVNPLSYWWDRWSTPSPSSGGPQGPKRFRGR